MDRDFLIELFAGFGPVTIRRMFSGYGVSADGINFALVLRGAVYLRADEQTIPRFENESCGPFRYEAGGEVRMIASYWQMPERLYDDPDEVTEWARAAHAAAGRAALKKASRKRKPAKKVVKKKPARRTTKKTTGKSTRTPSLIVAGKKTPSS
jgi:DNA transformation protein